MSINNFDKHADSRKDISDLKPYFKDDLKRIMESALYTAQQSGAEQNQDYWQGFQAALKALAIAIGLAR
jgi:hypothetical protein